MVATYLSSINASLHELMSDNNKVLVIGEDICDPYGGAFKVTKGLSNKYSNRVFNTPISESAIVGIGTGLALQGYLPVVEIMFGDFSTLIVDQILNSASKFSLMYGDDVRVPLVVRTPMGGGRGYGPTHSQSIEKIFFGMPGVKVISPSLAHDPGKLLRESVLDDGGVVIYVEYKNIYTSKLICDGDNGLSCKYIDSGNGNTIAIVENFTNKRPDVVIMSYGGLSEDIGKLLKNMIDDEINIRAIFPSVISESIHGDEIKPYLDSEYGLIVAESGVGGFGWVSEIVKSLFLNSYLSDPKKVKALSSNSNIIPASEMKEKDVLLDYEKIMSAVTELMI